MANSLDLSELTSTLGAYCRENKAEIYTRVLQKVSKDHFTPVAGSDQIPLPRLSTASILKPANPSAAFSGTAGALKIGARILKIRRTSFDVQIIPSLIWPTWLGMMKARTSDNPFDLPFEALLMERLTSQAGTDMELSGIWKGVYNAAGTTPADTIDGILTIVAAEIITGEIPAGNVYTSGGAITATNAVAQLEGVKGKVSDVYLGQPLKMFVSRAVKDFYEQDYRTRYGVLPYNTSFEKTMLDGTNIELVAAAGMAGSQRVIITTQDNICFGDHTEGNIDLQKFDRYLKVLGDFGYGIEICDGAVLWCNDRT
jgi:hypothetical protein